MTISCVLWGGYAGGNVGDELTLAVGYRDMLAKFSKDQLAILSPNPAISASQFPDANIIKYEKMPPGHFLNVLYRHTKRHRVSSELLLEFLLEQVKRWYIQSEFDWVRAINEADELYLVGGGYLTDIFQLDSILLPVLIAQHFGKEVVTAPVGVGPFSNPVNQRIFQKTFRDVKLTVRDPQSQQLCQNLDLIVDLAMDDGFKLRELTDFQNISEEPSKNGKIGMCIYHQHGSKATSEAYSVWWKTLLQELIALELSDKIEGFCFHTSPGLDHQYLVNIFEEVGLPLDNIRVPSGNYIQSLKQLSQYNLVISTRFHAAVAASAFNIPFIAVSSGAYYQNKMDSVVQGQDFGRSIDLQNSDPKTIALEVAMLYKQQLNSSKQ